MLGLLLVALLSLGISVAGIVVDGLFWLTLVGIALFLGSAALGEAKGLSRARDRTRTTAARG
ncbi:hypothetical protein E4P41_00560 [Geodermatophilus sp. DF01-2]|uniref:hypothetical protein n=1 Tax=Geodermatophilus sp. DF01-2 TaxID=2559610 RepID=UPI001073A430|nr:hypothetical protein [Geodermatophilus sp. DF01_2]TFV64765.1 hypothetical protein E4P41_00560 [Geodermatophilus sp. DF01_2]